MGANDPVLASYAARLSRGDYTLPARVCVPEHERRELVRAPEEARVRAKVVRGIEIVLDAGAHHEARIRHARRRIELPASFDVAAARAVSAHWLRLDGERGHEDDSVAAAERPDDGHRLTRLPHRPLVLLQPKPRPEPPSLEQVVKANNKEPAGIAGLVFWGGLKGVGEASKALRQTIEALDLYVGRYLLLTTVAYIGLKFVHFKIFDPFP